MEEQKYGYIYGLATKEQGIRYIGMTEGSIEGRFQGHLKESIKGRSYKNRWFRKYRNEIYWVKIEKVEIEQLAEVEKWYIETYHEKLKLTNTAEGGKGGNNIKYMSDEDKKKFSERYKGENNSMYGIKHTEETKQKMSESQKGKPRKQHSEETKQKMSEAKKLYWINKKLNDNN